MTNAPINAMLGLDTLAETGRPIARTMCRRSFLTAYHMLFSPKRMLLLLHVVRGVRRHRMLLVEQAFPSYILQPK